MTPFGLAADPCRAVPGRDPIDGLRLSKSRADVPPRSPKPRGPFPPHVRQAAVAAYARGDKLAVIEAEHGIHDTQILRWAKRAAIPLRGYKSRLDEAEVRRLHLDGWSDRAIARELGMSLWPVRSARVRMGLPRNFNPYHWPKL
jgi:hypothetical protein